MIETLGICVDQKRDDGSQFPFLEWVHALLTVEDESQVADVGVEESKKRPFLDWLREFNSAEPQAMVELTTEDTLFFHRRRVIFRKVIMEGSCGL